MTKFRTLTDMEAALFSPSNIDILVKCDFDDEPEVSKSNASDTSKKFNRAQRRVDARRTYKKNVENINHSSIYCWNTVANSGAIHQPFSNNAAYWKTQNRRATRRKLNASTRQAIDEYFEEAV